MVLGPSAFEALEEAGAAGGGADAQETRESTRHAERSGNPRERCSMNLFLLPRERRARSTVSEMLSPTFRLRPALPVSELGRPSEDFLPDLQGTHPIGPVRDVGSVQLLAADLEDTRNIAQVFIGATFAL